MALAAAGIEEEKIIEDYAKSQEGLARVRSHMVKEMAKDGLDPSFADSPPEVCPPIFSLPSTLTFLVVGSGFDSSCLPESFQELIQECEKIHTKVFFAQEWMFQKQGRI